MFKTMCQFRCILKLTADNGAEFDGAITKLAERYKVPVTKISTYNPRANGMVEQGHGVWIEPIWKVLQGFTDRWPDYFYAAMWADQVTVKRSTGYTPYYLVYGQHALHPFDILDWTWHALDWSGIQTTEELLRVWIMQFVWRDEDIGKASMKQQALRQKVADYFYKKNKNHIVTGNYEPGTRVLVYNKFMDNQHGLKGHLRWSGPYVVVQKRPLGAFMLAELDGNVFKKPIAALRVKLFYTRESETSLLQPQWRVKQKSMEYKLSEDELEGGNFESNFVQKKSFQKVKPGI
jgi:hypothetical protein